MDFRAYLDEIEELKVTVKMEELLTSIPAFDIGDITIFGYNLLKPHFDEIMGASGYPYPANFNDQGNYYYDLNDLQNSEGIVYIVDGDVYRAFILTIPVDGDFRADGSQTGGVSTIGYNEYYYDNTKAPWISLSMRKVNGEETDAF